MMIHFVAAETGGLYYFHKAGLKSEDILPITSGFTLLSTIKASDPEVYDGMKQQLKGALNLSQNGFVGDVGE